jgi:dienelactone hydrolase
MARVPAAATLLVAMLLMAGSNCGGEDEPCRAEPPASVRALYSVTAGQVTPFPSDLFTVPDPVTRTGRRLALTQEGTPLIAEGLGLLMPPEELASQLNTLDGFGIWSPILLPFSGAIDDSSLPATPEESTLPASSVFVVDVSSDSSGFGERVPVWVELRALEAEQGVEYLLALRPRRPLQPGTRFAAVVTRRVLAADGSPVEPTAEFSYIATRCPIPADHPDRQLLESRRDALEPLFAPPLGIDPGEVAVATVFTTQSAQAELRFMREVMQNDVAAPQVDFDLDADGQPDLYAPADLPYAPEGATRLEHIDLVARGAFEAPQFRGADGVFQPGPDDTPEVISLETIPLVLILPANPAFQPFPVVILQHGHGARKEYALYLAGYLAERGMAVIAIDLVEHGERPDTGHGFIEFSNFLSVRANFEQGAVDLMRLVQVVEGLAAVDFAPGGGGDGAPDLDVSRVAIVGESAGAQVATMAAALEPTLGAAVINVGGGGYSVMMEHFMGPLFGERGTLQLGLLVQTLFERGDPINFYRSYLLEEPGGPETQVLVQEVIGDTAMYNQATEDLARVFGCPLVSPYAREVDGLEIVDSPATQQGLFQYDPAKHGFLLAEDEYPEASAAVRQQVATFLRTYFDDGTGVIENPWE